MKKTYSILLLVSFLAIFVLTGCSSKGISGNEDEVRISLYGEVGPASAIISKDKDSIVVDPSKVTSLYISNPGNSDLVPLKYFTNLKYLRIDDFFTEKKSDTYDLSPLRDLPLVALDIAGLDSEKPMSIKSLEPIGNIESLAILNLEHCQVTSVKDLAGLTKLSSLYIKDASDIEIEDLSSLSGLINLGEMSDTIEESKEWKFGPYMLSEDEPLLGLTISNGNSEEEIAELRSAIYDNKRGLDQVSTKEDDTDIYYFMEYSTHKLDSNNNEALVNVFLDAFDKKGEPAWAYSWQNIRPTELNVASETVTYDGKVYKEVRGTLYCFDAKNGKTYWENSNDVGGGAFIYPYRDRIYLTSYYGNVLTCLDKDSGSKIWAIEDKDMYWGHVIFSHNDEIIVGYGENDNFLSVHYQDGRILDKWRDGRIPDNNIGWARASASSVLEDNHTRYGAMNVIDNNSQTAWSEGAKGYGIDEWIQIERDGYEDVRRIVIANGYHKSQETFNNNGRLKSFRLDFSQGQYIYCEVDESKTRSDNITITLDRPISTDSIRLTILDVYKGSKYEDTCITDIFTYR
ncbi:MAG: PQQ-binding-like beta-propeller repeat protein [Clostridiales bacterium]|jgi:hypothetical protein|nr:PQQ-binding-like beta-propeller repeat protein [Clostridiales bacterium]